MPYERTRISGLVVEAEHTRTSLRLFDENKRIFTCEITAVGPDQARVTVGNAIVPLTRATYRAVLSWLSQNGYSSGYFERENGEIHNFRLAQ